MPLPNLVAMQVVAERLGGLSIPYAFVGGSIVNLLLDDPRISPARPTDDVDVILEVTTSVPYSDIEDRIRKCGFAHDMRPGAPKCRWILDNLKVDIMPTEGSAMGLNTTWFKEALSTATEQEFEHIKLRLISPVAFLATKYAAFLDRGGGDCYGSHDLEDFMTVVHGRSQIEFEIDRSLSALRHFVVQAIRSLLVSPDFVEALSCFVPSSSNVTQLAALQQKLDQIASLVIS